jgi:hypothetical protein
MYTTYRGRRRLRFQPAVAEVAYFYAYTSGDSHPLDRKLALDKNSCLQILLECRLLRGGSACVARLSDIPDGLNVVQLKAFLREHGRQIVTVSG